MAACWSGERTKALESNLGWNSVNTLSCCVTANELLNLSELPCPSQRITDATWKDPDILPALLHVGVYYVVGCLSSQLEGTYFG